MDVCCHKTNLVYSEFSGLAIFYGLFEEYKPASEMF